MKTIIVTMLIALGMLGFSCKKYEYGPGFSLETKKQRVANNWRVAKAMQNGTDVTDDYEDQHYSLLSSGDATLRTTYRSLGQDYEEITNGTWIFQSNKEKIYMNFSDDSKDANFRITKLFENEMWLKNDANNVELHLIPL